MPGSLSIIDILFLITVALLVFNGFTNGAVTSLVNLISLPVGFAVAYFFGPRFTVLLAANGLPATPLISYIILFFGTVFLLHIVGTTVRGVVTKVPLVGIGDRLLGAFVGFIEAWLLWVILLFILGNFLHSVQDTLTSGSQIVPGLNIRVDQLKNWHDFYNTAVTNSLFAKVNGLFVQVLPSIQAKLPKS
ncbi:MAG: CvpA family protein [Chloroflexota bacterium]|nr:CvpA family protein [Chloroflexota bacterium]